MGWFTNKATDGQNKGSGNWLVDSFFTVIAFFILIVREPRIWLSDKVYRGFSGGCRACLGLIFAFGASYAVGNHLGWTLGYPTLAWLAAGVGAWIGTYCYAWPALYHFVIRNVFDLVEAMSKHFRKWAKDYAEKTFNGLVLGMAYALPGSRRAWKAILDEKRTSFIDNLTGAMSFLAMAAGSCYVGWQTFVAVSALAFWGMPAVPFIAGVAAGVLALGVIGAILFNLLSYGKLSFTATALTAVLTYIYTSEIIGYGAALGLSGSWIYASLAVFVVAFLGYVFPYTYWALSGDLVKRVLEQIRKLENAAYRDQNKEYVSFFGHACNLIATAAIGYGAYYVCGLIGLTAFAAFGLSWLGLACTVAVVVTVVAIAYLGVYAFLFDKHSSGLGWPATIASFYIGYKTMVAYAAAGLAGGYWLGAPLGGLVALLVGAVLIPVAYLAIRFVLLLVKAEKLAAPLDKLYHKVEEGFTEIGKRLSKVYEVTYRDRSGYQEWFLHASNIAFASGLGGLSLALSAWAGYSLACTLGLTIPLVVLSYILVGKFLLKSSVGTEFLGVTSGLIAAIKVGTLLHAALPSGWLTVFVGFFTWLLVVFIFFPIGYLIVRFPAKPLLASWSLKPLALLHNAAWSSFKVVADGVSAAYDTLKVWMTPLVKKIGEALAAVKAAYERVKGRMGGGKK